MIKELLAEYNERMVLKGLGFESSLKDLNIIEAEIYFVINNGFSTAGKKKKDGN